MMFFCQKEIFVAPSPNPPQIWRLPFWRWKCSFGGKQRINGKSCCKMIVFILGIYLPRHRQQQPGLPGYIRLNCIKSRIFYYLGRPCQFFSLLLAAIGSYLKGKLRATFPLRKGLYLRWILYPLLHMACSSCSKVRAVCLPINWTRARGAVWEVKLCWYGLEELSPAPAPLAPAIKKSLYITTLLERAACGGYGYKGNIFYLEM